MKLLYTSLNNIAWLSPLWQGGRYGNTNITKTSISGKFATTGHRANTTAHTLLDTAVREFLDKWSSQKIQAESNAFAQLHPQLVAKYLGAYVAIHNGAVVDHDTELRALHLRIRQRFGRMSVLLRQVNPELETRDLMFRRLKFQHLA